MSEVVASAATGRAREAGYGRGDDATRLLLGCGVVAGPLYLVLGMAQALTREGFDLARHPLSLLANGPGGWVQTGNFLLTGALVLAAAVGLARVLRPNGRWASRCLGGFGAGMIVAGVFPADPVDGFPPGTPEGFPTSISTTGLVHFAAGGLGFAFLAAAGFLAAWALWRRDAPVLAAVSLLSGAVVGFGFFGGMALPLGILGIWAAVVVGFAWLSFLSLRLNRPA